MTKVLTKTDFVDQLQEIKTMDFAISQSRGCPILEPTKRNKVRAELLQGLKDYLASILMDEEGSIGEVYLTSEGVAVELENQLVGAKTDETCNGMITLVFDITFKNLVYDAYNEAIAFDEEKQAKEAAELERAKVKAKKPRNNKVINSVN